MISFSILLSTLSLWVCLFLCCNYLVHPSLSPIKLKYLHRRIVRLIDWFIIVSICLYQVYLIHFRNTFDKLLQESLQHSQVTFFTYELFLFLFWLRNYSVLSLVHHVSTILLVSAVLAYDLMLEQSPYIWLLLETTIFSLHVRDILRDFDRTNTKIMMIIEYTYPFMFIFTKVVMRAVFMYYEFFVWDASNVVRCFSIIIQILFVCWSWLAWKTYKEKQNSGYFSWNNFKIFPWLHPNKKAT